MKTAEPTAKSTTINMRVDFAKKSLIDSAVDLLGTDRTAFILDAACRKAEEVLLDRRLFLLDDDAFDRFERALDEHPFETNECAKKLLSREKRWS